MKAIIRFFIFAFAGAIISSYYTQEAFAQAHLTSDEDVSDITMWRMVSLRDFGQKPMAHEDSPKYLKDFIRSVTINTAVIDGELLTTRAYAGCNGMGRDMRRRVVTPARTVETIVDGTPKYTTIPATYKTYLEWFTTQTGCVFGRKIDGEVYEANWIGKMEGFLGTSALKAIHSRDGNSLKWLDTAGHVLAEFEKLPDIAMHRHNWRLDPDYHDIDPHLLRNFGPATLSISFPKLSAYTPCGRVFAPIDVTDSSFSISDEVRVFPCESLSYLLNGQRLLYTPNENAVHNILARHLPSVSKYAVSEDGDNRRLVLSNEDGNALLHLISTDEQAGRSHRSKMKTYDRLDKTAWIIEPTRNVTSDMISALSPIRIFRHHGYYNRQHNEDTPKARAALISTQDCALSGLNIDGQSAYFNKNPNLRAYKNCDSVAANALVGELGKAKRQLFDGTHLIFYDRDWNEVLRMRRGESLKDSEGP